MTILLLTFVLKQQRNVNNKYENEYISVCCMANDNNFSSFRDLCLETVKRFIDYEWKCIFRLSTAKDILQDGSFLFLNFFSYCCDFLFLNFVVLSNCNLFTFVIDVWSISKSKITFEIVPIWFTKANVIIKWFHRPAFIETLN